MFDKLINKEKTDTEYYFFSGKGGVGKTSMAAATALWFSNQGKKTLIISTDPAHSLSDSYKTRIGGDIKELRKKLFAVEIDPQKAMYEYKEKLAPQIQKIDALEGMGLEDMFDVSGLAPGIDEIAAFDKFLQYINSKEYDIIIFDTAPTGHALRFLSLPDVLDSWVGKMIKLRMKLSGMMNMFKKILPFGDPESDSNFGLEQLEGMKERIKQAKQILTNPVKTHYNIVMIPEMMSILESERAIQTLNEYGIPVETIIVNQIFPKKTDCNFCEAKRKQQIERMESIDEKFNKHDIKKVELFKEEVEGFSVLEKLSEKIHSDSS
jgi:arsenite-transporting ATPase